jgi:serine/threonine-protein kinase
VYLAHDTKLDRSVAIKSLPPEVKDNPKALSRFTREARVLASLNHPNIATIHEELEEAEGSVYLVLEYVPGQTLAERIAKGPLKLEEALTIALQIAEAVAAAHERDVIHRDLKPGNIKITQEGKVKVLDFGLAKVIGGETTDQKSTITEPGRVIGTPAYMSPEQARGKTTDKRSDIWSFGCVLYEMLTGRIPFKGETISDTLCQRARRQTSGLYCVTVLRKTSAAGFSTWEMRVSKSTRR